MVLGKQAKRRQWRMKQACFEEAARLPAANSGRESYCRDGGQMRRFGAECTDGGAGCGAPIFFGLRPKKTAAPREKKGALCRKFGIRRMPLCLVTGVERIGAQ